MSTTPTTTTVIYNLKEACHWSMFRKDVEEHRYVDIETTYSNGKKIKQTLELPSEQAKHLCDVMHADWVSKQKDPENELKTKTQEPGHG